MFPNAVFIPMEINSLESFGRCNRLCPSVDVFFLCRKAIRRHLSVSASETLFCLVFTLSRMALPAFMDSFRMALPALLLLRDKNAWKLRIVHRLFVFIIFRARSIRHEVARLIDVTWTLDVQMLN